MNYTLEAALRYAKGGFKVIPLYPVAVWDGKCTCVLGEECKSPGKHPMTLNGVNDATLDQSIISNWFNVGVPPNVGIATGTDNKHSFVVLDLDGEDGWDSCKELFADLGITSREHFEEDYLSSFPYVRTPRGIHFYFTVPAHVPLLRCSTGKLGKGLDVRANGGYVVAPPSVNTDGPYEWKNLDYDDSFPYSRLQRIPDTLLDVLRAAPAPREAPGEGDTVPEGERNAMLTSVGGKLRRMGLDRKAIAAALQEVNEEHCSPPLDEAEVEAIAYNLSKYDPGEDMFDSFPVIKKLDWDNPPAKPEWFIEGLIAKGDVVLMVGEPAAQKSWLAMSLSVSTVNRDDEWAGMKLYSGNGCVVYIDEENQADEALRRLTKLGFDSRFSGNKLHYYSQQQLRLDKNPEPLFQVIADLKPDLVVLDSLIRFHTEDESNNSAMAKMWNNGIMPLSRRYGATTLILHHVNKTEDEKSFRRVRGAGDITAAVDLGLDVRVPHSGNYRHLRVFKPRHLVSYDSFYLRVQDEGEQTNVIRVHPEQEQEVPF